MKYLTIVFIILLLTGACCKKGPYPVPALKVNYPNLSTNSYLKAIRTERTDLSAIIDTISLGELNSSNSFSVPITFNDSPPNYIIFVENTAYTDTISNINFERKGCKNNIKNFNYKFNGQVKTDDNLTIN
ncbi:MAG TPA: hypothetical protein EYG85_10920 [Crocinitomix sp.]|nr:hypothetical protein [Crocinitomix sp.]